MMIINGWLDGCLLVQGQANNLTLFHNAQLLRQMLRYLLQVWTDASEPVSNDGLRFPDVDLLNEEGEKQTCSRTLFTGFKTLYVEEPC